MNQIPEDAVVAARGVGRDFAVGGEVVHAVRDVSLDIFPAEVVVLLGRSGSGKTTLLNLLGGLDTPTEGVVYLRGRDLSTFSASELAQMRRTDLGFVFQTFGLLPLLSAQENVELPLRIAGASRSERERLARVALDTVGLLHRVRHRPYELSGGEQQRVAIARALANAPKLLLADEPTGNLDPGTAGDVFSVLLRLARGAGLAALVATHNPALAARLDRTVRLENGVLVPE